MPPRSRVGFAHILLSSLLSAMLLVQGCASLPERPPPPPITGDPKVDARAKIDYALPADRSLETLQVALEQLRAANPELAKSFFDEALSRIAQSVNQPNPEAARARRRSKSESIKPFVGEPYERVMANLYRGLLYWADGEPDNARALFRSAQLIDTGTLDPGHSGDYIVLDYLDGFASAKLGGDGNDALLRAKENLNKAGLPPALLPDYSPANNVLVFVEYGRASIKIASGKNKEQLAFQSVSTPIAQARLEVAGKKYPLPPLDDLAHQATTRGPRVMDQVLANKSALKNTSGAIGAAALQVAYLAIEDLLTPTPAPLPYTYALRNEKNKNTRTGKTKDDSGTTFLIVVGALVVVGVAALMFAESTDTTADTRNWDGLPRYLSLATMQLPAGDHSAQLFFYDHDGRELPSRTQTFTIRVPYESISEVADEKNKQVVVFCRDVNR